MKNVYCIGELLIDFVGEGHKGGIAEAAAFLKKAGGAPANVAAAVSRLGGKAYFVGAVGKDAFGDFLKATLSENGVNTDNLQRSGEFTTLAFVSLDQDGERDFVFNRGADADLAYDDELAGKMKGSVVHFGSATGFLEGTLAATYHRYLESLSNTDGTLISFDPNFRGDLWKHNQGEFIDKSKDFLGKAHLAKFSIEEARLLSGEQDTALAAEKLLDSGLQCCTITLGKEGTYLACGGKHSVVGSIAVNAVDTTGAGDAFIGCLLSQLAESDKPLALLQDHPAMKEMVMIANKAGALTTMGYGAIPSLPYRKDIGY
ncbi:carbohydrate kinase family protein [Robertkochia aurantiaca]|uniref:carbohydrate kinase family protein n=1 Tax=Robertkochia aurantiaca TaxID=2873700 RepID=UPI001CCEE9BF|nr:carbohydrate kinase [Robertkochia sp. 3YJGBD-33]